MQGNMGTHRSQTSSRYATPRQATAKKKHITLKIAQFEQSVSQNVQPAKQWHISDFEILRQMGRGKFGYVYAAKEKSTDYVVALKKMSKQELRENEFQEQVKREIAIQESLRHENVLKLYGYFWDADFVYLILEYAPQGELFQTIQAQKRLPESQVSVIIRQVCKGLSYLHSHSVIHRDIKPQNILISNSRVKIADFGWSVYSEARRETLCGTLDYLAPEIVTGGTHDNSIDVWQVGVLAYELAVGRPPFETPSHEQTYHRIVSDEVSFPGFISYELRQFIRRILQKQPALRLTCEQILQQPFITKYWDTSLQL